MASLLWATNGFSSGGSPDTSFRSYDNDSGVWTSYTGWPNAGNVTTSNAVRQQGAWDGTYWYIIGSDAKLYRMHGTTRVWSAALNGGVSPFAFAGSTHLHGWVMCSDGRFVYILTDSNDFRRYNPNDDTFTVLAAPPLSGGIASRLTFLAYDGVDTIYAHDVDVGNSKKFLKYTISTSTWAAISAFTFVSVGVWVGAVCLQGKMWVLWYDNGNFTTWRYSPGGDTWTQLAQYATSDGIQGSIPYGEDTDGTWRIWWKTSNSLVYNLGTDIWSLTTPSPQDYGAVNGFNWAVTHLFSPAYTYYQADGVTLLTPDYFEGNAVIGQTITHQIKVYTQQARGSGATVTVVNNTTTDAEEAVSICQTAGGSYTNTFTTGALGAGATFDVFVKVTPTTQQTTGSTKHWSLRTT